MAIDLSQQARADPLFPLLDYLVKSSHRQQKPVNYQALENCKAKLVKEFGESTFNIDKSPYKVCILLHHCNHM